MSRQSFNNVLDPNASENKSGTESSLMSSPLKTHKALPYQHQTASKAKKYHPPLKNQALSGELELLEVTKEAQ